MPRLPRFDLPGYPLHVVQRGNNRQAVFFEDSDYRAYLEWLGPGARQYGVAVRAWCLMIKHVHLLVTPRERYSARTGMGKADVGDALEDAQRGVVFEFTFEFLTRNSSRCQPR